MGLVSGTGVEESDGERARRPLLAAAPPFLLIAGFGVVYAGIHCLVERRASFVAALTRPRARRMQREGFTSQLRRLEARFGERR